MKIWVDADACPVVIKEILYKAAMRTGVHLTLVANQFLKVPASKYIDTIRVPGGPDVADSEIVNQMQTGDLVITGDIPLAARVIDKGGYALNPRGEMYSTETIHERLSVRDFMDTLRSCGIETGGPQVLKLKDRQTFANRLDSFLRQHCKGK